MRTLLATLGAFGAIAAPAAAQATATATPNQAGKGTKLHTSLDATQPPVSGRLPTQTVLSIQSGYTFDPAAVAKRCTADQAGQDKCPAKSKIGSATVMVEYMGSPITIPIGLYLAKPPQPGDFAGFQAVAQFLGTHAVTGRVVRSSFGISVILPSPGGDSLSSFPVTFKSFTSDLGATRVIVKRAGHGKHRHVVKRTRHHLIRNPATCAGTWASNAVLTFSDASTAELDAPISCVS